MARLLLIVALASCGPPRFTGYELDTKVARDGTWTRTYTTRGYRQIGSPPDAPDYQRINGVHCAALPACPPRAGEEPARELPACAPEELWPLRHEMVDDNCGAVLERETFRRTGKANADIAPDIQRTGVVRGTERVAGNTINIRRHDLGVLVFYDYREIFRQWITPADVIDAGREALGIGFDFAIEVMRAELALDYDTTKLEAFARAALAELTEIVVIAAYTDLDWERASEEVYRRLRRHGVPFDDEGRPDEERIGEWFDAHISPMLSPKRERAPRLTWLDLNTETFQQYLEEKWKPRIEELSKEDGPLRRDFKVLEGPFGATRFRLRVELPGRLLDTDGSVGTDGQVSWNVNPKSFEIDPREVHALSVEMNPRFAKLYPKADVDGQGLVDVAKTASELNPEEMARLAALLSRKATTELAAWCGESLAVRNLVRRLGLTLECRAGQVDRHRPPR